MSSIYRTLKEVQPQISNKRAKKMSSSSGEHEIKNWKGILSAIIKIKDIEIFKDVGQELFNNSPVFGENIETLKITSSQANKFNNWNIEITNQIDTIIKLCESVGYGSAESSFEVKLPETNELAEFSSHISNLSKAIQICPFIKSDDSSIELTKTDIGSTWLVFTIVGATAISMLAGLGYLVQSALKIKSMHLTCEQQKEAIRGSRVKNDLTEDITNLYKDMIKATASNEVERLEERLDRPLTAEERTSAEKSMEILGRLMSKGLEIYATLDAPQEAKDVFPSIEQQGLLPTPIRLLSGNLSDKTDNN